MKNKIAWTVLASVLALSWCDKPSEENIAQEKIEEVTKDSSENVEKALEKSTKKFFNNFIQIYTDENGKKRISINPYWIFFPIWIEKAENQTEINWNFSNFYHAWKWKEEYFSTLKDFKIWNENEIRSKFANKWYQSQIETEIKIISADAKWYSSQEYSNTSDKDLFNEEYVNQNKNLVKLRWMDISNDFLATIQKEFKVSWIENIEISWEILPFSNEEIWKLYEIWLKYYKHDKGSEINIILNLIKLYDLSPEKISDEDYVTLQNIIWVKRFSSLDINYDIIWANKEISISYLNILVLLFYTFLIYGWIKFSSKKYRKNFQKINFKIPKPNFNINISKFKKEKKENSN